MIHPHTELKFISHEIGYGVVATKFIPKGTITWVLDKLDKIISPVEFEAFDEHYKEILNKYCYRDGLGRHVLCWDIAKYVNHSFNSSCVSTAYDFEIASRDIFPGEELTDDYGYLNVNEPFECIKEKGSNRNVVYPDDLLNFHQYWDKKALEAFDFFKQVPQPLIQFLSPENTLKADLIAQKKIKMDSILQCYFNPNNKK
jgi:hypothetical protein